MAEEQVLELLNGPNTDLVNTNEHGSNSLSLNMQPCSMFLDPFYLQGGKKALKEKHVH